MPLLLDDGVRSRQTGGQGGELLERVVAIPILTRILHRIGECGNLQVRWKLS
jgi:hypothetical protein